MTHSPTQTAQVVLETLPSIMHFVRSEMRRHGAGTLSVPQFRALGYLKRRPGAALSGVADHLGITPATASAMVERLVQQGLVDRQSDPRERRRHQLTLTTSGRDLLQGARAATQDRVAGVLGSLSPADLATVSQGLALLSQAFQEVQPHDRTADQA